VATQALMIRFHRNLWEKHMAKLDPLREAQLWLIKE
jgi:CHAT domain-containing protein